MSELAVIYKQANDQVLKKYQEEPEDRWKLAAIAEHRAGTAKHDSVMNDFVQDVEKVVTELFNGAAAVPVVVAPTVSPNAKKAAPLPPAQNRPKTPDNPAGLDLGWD
jgi:hypothetical protein